MWDGTTPYGYGGAFAWSVEPREVEAFWHHFTEWARESGLVSVVTRQSLFPEQLAEFPGEIVPRAPNVVCSLDATEEDIWKGYAHKVRKNVKRALASGLRVEVDEQGTMLEHFLSVYYETMDRREALARYKFPREFFDQICSRLAGHFAFFHVLKGQAVLSSELVLLSAATIYSFLGGTRVEAYALRPNDLLKHHIITWGHRAGKKTFVLGGGYGGPDGILRYKLGFAPLGLVTFKIGRLIVDTRGYDSLLESRRRWEAVQGRIWEARPDFFPGYRS